MPDESLYLTFCSGDPSAFPRKLFSPDWHARPDGIPLSMDGIALPATSTRVSLSASARSLLDFLTQAEGHEPSIFRLPSPRNPRLKASTQRKPNSLSLSRKLYTQPPSLSITPHP